MRKTRILAAFLAAVMLLPTLASCANDIDTPDETRASTQAFTEEDTGLHDDLPDDLYYNGDEVTIKGEFTSNGFPNNLLHNRGVVSMARTNDPDSASSQFFIMHQKTESLDGKYASFGYVVYGMDTVDGIAGTECKRNSAGENSSPVNPVTINFAKFVTVENEAVNEITE